jgi:hypothetical protein
MSQVSEEIIDKPLDFDGIDGANEGENESFNSALELPEQNGQNRKPISNRIQKFSNAQQKIMEETRKLRGSKDRSVSFSNGTKANRKRNRKNRKTRKNRKGSRKN